MSASLPVVNAPRTDEDRRLHPYCQECKLQCESAGKSWKKVTSNCHGVYDEEDFEEIAAKSDVPIESVRELYNPRNWFAQHLGLMPHWYQDRAVRCTSARKAFRWGRRTGKTHLVAAWLCQQAFIHRRLKALCITPMKSQAKEIFDRLLAFFEENPTLGADARHKQQPYYEINFKNGSRIRIFVAGTASGSSAATQVRGQEADIIFIDEMDYLDDDASKAILPVLFDPPRVFDQVHFIGSSTPSGKEGTFFKICHDEHYREFWVPSRFRPDWNERMQAECEALAKTKTNYEHEYEAEWGSKVDGVFKRNDIIKAGQEYRYYDDEGVYEQKTWPEMKRWPHWKYIMGVDWNGAGTGTRILILGFDPARGKWIVVYREVSETALHIATTRVVEVNRKWRCHAVYIDSGYGQMQDEVLRGIGRAAQNAQARGEDYQVADLTLATHLRSIDFGGWVKYKAKNIDGKLEEVKKRVKNYMVEHLQAMFELEDIWISKSDNDLKQQLMGYIVKRQDQHGQLIYGADEELGDHDLDALLLAAYGFNREFDPQWKKREGSPIIIHRRPGQHEAAAEPGPDPFTQPAAYRKHQEEKAKESARRRGADIPSRAIKPKHSTRTHEHGPGWVVVQTTPAQTRGGSRPGKIPNRNAWRTKAGMSRVKNRGI